MPALIGQLILFYNERISSFLSESLYEHEQHFLDIQKTTFHVILNVIFLFYLLQIHLKIIVDQPGHGINQENHRSNHPHWQLPVVQNGCSILNINSLTHSWACIWMHAWKFAYINDDYFCMNTVCLSHAVLALSSFCFHLVPNKRTKPKNNQFLFQFWHYFEKGSLTHRIALYSIDLRLEPIAI